MSERVDRPFYLVVEKILAPHERLRSDWPIEGTTGYDFLNLSLGLLDRRLRRAGIHDDVSLVHRRWMPNFEDLARICKIEMMDNEMASELAALGRSCREPCRQSPMTVDLTRSLLQRAIKQVIACLPVYRSYVDLTGSPTDADSRDIAWAFARARRCVPDLHRSAFDFLENILSANIGQPPTDKLSRTAALRFAMKFQQLSGPVMAKGVEDTAFYRYNRFLALERSRRRARIGLASRKRISTRRSSQHAEHWPHAMLSTATHDTKRGEDSRARLAVLSECPRSGAATSWRGAGCCERAAASWTARHRRTKTTSICSTR